MGTHSLNRTQFSQELRLTTDKWNLVNIKCYYTAKETIEWIGSPHNGYKSLSAKHLLDDKYL